MDTGKKIELVLEFFPLWGIVFNPGLSFQGEGDKRRRYMGKRARINCRDSKETVNGK